MITIYPQDCTDFSTNGLGALTPIRCVASAADGHYTDLELEQPIDSTNRWALLVCGAIVRAPVPSRENPEYEVSVSVPATETVTVQREVYRVRVNSHLRLRSGPGTNHKILDAYENGVRVVKIGQDGSWYKVTVQKGGKTGWMYSGYLTYVESITEQVTREQAAPSKRAIQLRPSDHQLWRIYSVEPDTDKGTVTAKAQHIFYDLQYNLVGEDYAPEAVPAQTALQAIWQKLSVTPEHVLRIPYEITKKIDGDYGFKNPIECMLDGDDGVLSQAGARLVLDNYDVWILPDTERDTGVTIRRGKNLKGVKVTTDESGVVTRIIPRGKNKDGDPLYITGGTGAKGDGVDSSHIAEYPAPRIQMKDYDVKVVDKDPDGEKTFPSNSAARAKLLELAQAEFDENGADLASYGLKVDFILLENSGDSTWAGLQSVFLGDTVTVIDSLIGVSAKVEVVGFKFNCLSGQYESLELGDVQEVTQKVFSYQLPTGGVSGTKIARNSADGSVLRDLSVQYAKIDTAAVEQLSANALSAITAHIGALTAGTITTDELVASVAHMLNLTAANISAQGIQTDTLAAQLADIAVLCAGTGNFDRATVRHLVANAMNLEYGVGDTVSITNLRVAYAQMASAAIGNLCVKASNGSYYALDVAADGTVSATPATVTEEEIDAGQTDAGRVILGTDITAANLSTGNLLGTYALINAIDAARIDVDQLIARQAFIDRLNTSLIANNQIIQMQIGSAVDALEIGGRNMIINTLHPDVSTAAKRPRLAGQQSNTGIRGTASTAEHGFRATVTESALNYQYIYFGNSANSSMNMHGLTAGQTYTFSADMSWKALSDCAEAPDDASYVMQFVFRAKHDGASAFSLIEQKDIAAITRADMGQVMTGRVEATFTVPRDAVAIYIGISCSLHSALYTAAGDYIELRNIKLETGSKATAWTPAPEDVDAATAAAQTAADNAASAAATAQGTAESAQTAAGNAQSTANSAASAASAAQSTADGAASAASAAQGTADSAVTAAATAQGTADSAVTAAATAQGTADSAVTAAATAQGTADSAVTAAGTAQSTANSAVTAAATAQSTAEAAQDSVDNLEIGGRNLLLHTAEPEAEDLVLTRSTISGDIITLTPTSAAAYAKYKTRFTLGDLRGKRLVFSVDVREIESPAGYGTDTINLYSALQLKSRENVAVASANDVYQRLYLPQQPGWSRYVLNIVVPDTITLGKQSILEDEGADDLVFSVYVGRAKTTCPIETRRWKLEFGDKPTDWTAAPEDGEAATAAAQSAADRAQAAADDALETTTQLTRYITITADEGMRQSVPGSTYSTLVDEVGYHIEQNGEKIASFYKRQLAVEEVRVGALRATPCIVQRRSADGGLVFIPEV